MTTHEPSTEHDLSTGLRENFDPRARWRAAIGAVRGLNRLASLSKATAALKKQGSSDSGGWKNGTGAGLDEDEDEEDEEGAPHGLKWEAMTPPHKKPTTSAINTVTPAERDKGAGIDSAAAQLTAEEEEELQIPGSFDMSNPRHGRKESADDEEDEEDEATSWSGFFKRMVLK